MNRLKKLLLNLGKNPSLTLILFFPQFEMTDQNKEDSIQVLNTMHNYIDGFIEGDKTMIQRVVSRELSNYGHTEDYRIRRNSGASASFIALVENAVKVHENRIKRGELPDSSETKAKILEMNALTAIGEITASWGIEYLVLEKKDHSWKIRMIMWQGPSDKNFQTTINKTH